MTNEAESGESFVVTDDSQMERLQLPNGFALAGDHIEIQLVYDGEDVVFRGEDGELTQMGTLCYLDWVLQVCVRDILDDKENPSEATTSLMGNVLANIISYLHMEMHRIAMMSRLQEMQASGGGGLASVLAAMAGAQVDMGDGEQASLMPVGAFVLGPNGLTPIDMGDPSSLASVLGLGEPEGEAIEGEAENTDDEDDDEDKITIG